MTTTLPDLVIKNAIVNGIIEIRKDPKIIDALFANMSIDQITSLKHFLLQNSIAFESNFPRDQELKLPAIILTMVSDDDSQEIIGNYMGAGTKAIGQPNLADTIGGHGASISDLSNLNTKVIGNIQVDSVGYDEETDVSTLYWNPIFSSEIVKAFANLPSSCFSVYTTRGRGAGQKHIVTRLSNNSLDIDGTFDPQLDGTTYIDLRYTEELGHIDGQPLRSYLEGDTALYERTGSFYDARFQLAIVTGSQIETVFLYTLVKGILLTQRRYIQKHCMHNLKVSGSEFAPDRTMQPNEAYSRSLTVSFKYEFGILEELEAFSRIDLTLIPKESDGDSCGPIVVSVNVND